MKMWVVFYFQRIPTPAGIHPWMAMAITVEAMTRDDAIFLFARNAAKDTEVRIHDVVLIPEEMKR